MASKSYTEHWQANSLWMITIPFTKIVHTLLSQIFTKFTNIGSVVTRMYGLVPMVVVSLSKTACWRYGCKYIAIAALIKSWSEQDENSINTTGAVCWHIYVKQRALYILELENDITAWGWEKIHLTAGICAIQNTSRNVLNIKRKDRSHLIIWCNIC